MSKNEARFSNWYRSAVEICLSLLGMHPEAWPATLAGHWRECFAQGLTPHAAVEEFALREKEIAAERAL